MVARLATVAPSLDALLSWQDSGVVPCADHVWAMGEALAEFGNESASGLLALWIAGYLGEIVCIMATRGGRWSEVIHAASSALVPRMVRERPTERRTMIPSPFREVVTPRPEERRVLRELWTGWNAKPRLPAQTSGYYRGLHEIVCDSSAPLVERRRVFDAVVEADLPLEWRRALEERARQDAA